MNTRRFVAALIAVILIVLSGCGISSEQSLPPSENSISEDSSNSTGSFSASQSQENQSLPSHTFSEDDSSISSGNSVVSDIQMLNPPLVLSGEELERLDFSTMEEKELVVLLQPVLDKAKYFCDLALMTDLQGIVVDYDPEAAILRPFRNDEEYIWHPYLNLPYKTIEELKQDMSTVFTPNNIENGFLLHYVFDHLEEYNGKLYFPSGLSSVGLTRRWDLSNMEIVSAEETKLTVSMPVSLGWGEVTVIAPLNFEIMNGYIVVDESYFAQDRTTE